MNNNRSHRSADDHGPPRGGDTPQRGFRGQGLLLIFCYYSFSYRPKPSTVLFTKSNSSSRRPPSASGPTGRTP